METRRLNLLWYDESEIKEAAIDLLRVDSWDSLRRETAHLTSFVEHKLIRVRFQTRDGYDLEEKYDEKNFFEGAGITCTEIILIDPENESSCEGKMLSSPRILMDTFLSSVQTLGAA